MKPKLNAAFFQAILDGTTSVSGEDLLILVQRGQSLELVNAQGVAMLEFLPDANRQPEETVTLETKSGTVTLKVGDTIRVQELKLRFAG